MSTQLNIKHWTDILDLSQEGRDLLPAVPPVVGQHVIFRSGAIAGPVLSSMDPEEPFLIVGGCYGPDGHYIPGRTTSEDVLACFDPKEIVQMYRELRTWNQSTYDLLDQPINPEEGD